MAKNTQGKTRDINKPYQVYLLGGWGETRILKHWSSTEGENKNPRSRVFCAVKTAFTHGGYDLGDVYVNEATKGELVYTQLPDMPPIIKAGYELETW